MAKNNDKLDGMKKAEESVDVDLPAGAPAGLPGDGDETTPSYVPAVRQGLGVELPSDEVVMDMEGVQAPWLKLVHGTSKKLLEANFNLGELVLKDAYCVCQKGHRLQAIILSYDEYYKERAYVEGKRAATFKTLKEAADAGFSTVWDDAKGLKPEVSRAMDLLLLIRRNEGVSDALFGVDIGVEEGGKPTDWAFALLSLDKGNYKSFKNDIGITVNNKLRKAGGIYTGLWELNAEMAPASPHSANRPFIIRARFKGVLDPTVVENIKGAMRVPVADRDDGDEA